MLSTNNVQDKNLGLTPLSTTPLGSFFTTLVKNNAEVVATSSYMEIVTFRGNQVSYSFGMNVSFLNYKVWTLFDFLKCHTNVFSDNS